MLTPEEKTRYGRHLILPQIGIEGQEKLKETAVLLIGAGGLGSPLSIYLAAAGVGRIGIVDFDTVDETNLQRQVLYGTSDIGRRKLDAAAERLSEINPNVRIDLHHERLTSDNAMSIFRGYDIVADGADNFPTRYLVNDAAVLSGIPNVYASIFRFDGQVSIFGMPDGPCYRCLYPEPPPPGSVPSCAEGGVLGVLPGIIGSMQAAEVIKLACGIGSSLSGRLLIYDALDVRSQVLRVDRNPDCPLCGEDPFITELIDYEAFCAGPDSELDSLAHDSEPRQQTGGVAVVDLPIEIDVYRFKELLESEEPPFVLDVREPVEYEIANLGGTLIPLGELVDRLSELEDLKNRTIVVHCRSGPRSMRAVNYLRNEGFEAATNLAGGILAWAESIDPSLPRY